MHQVIESQMLFCERKMKEQKNKKYEKLKEEWRINEGTVEGESERKVKEMMWNWKEVDGDRTIWEKWKKSRGTWRKSVGKLKKSER